MKSTELKYPRIKGKTYSLFGNSSSTHDYYKTIKLLADRILAESNIATALVTLKEYSSRKRFLKRIVSGKVSKSMISYCLNSVHEPLKQYTRNTADHLKNLPLSKLWDGRLATTEEQYHLYMLEIELTNRMNRNQFLQADYKISLQPYCLQDFSVNCKASDNGFGRTGNSGKEIMICSA